MPRSVIRARCSRATCSSSTPAQGHGHTGLVVGREGNEFQTIEGNTNELGGREGVGVFARKRPVRQATLGFVEFGAR